MHAVSRSYVLVGAMLAATGAIAVAPFVSRSSHLAVVSTEARLVDASDSILNIPVNLFDDVVNIPANEVQGLDTAADSLFFNDNIFVVAAANIFGVDPGDPGHVAAIDSLIAPFPAFDDGLGGLDYQLTGLLASELPISASCAVTTCYPIVPPDVITGITGIDRDIGFGKALFDPDFALFRNFFAVPITGPDSLLSGHTFDPTADGSIDPAGPVYSGFGFENGDPNFFLGGTVDPVTGAPAYDPTTGVFDPNATEVPWAGHTYTFDLLQPFENFDNSLLAPPSTDGLFGSGIESFTLTDVVQALQADAAGLVVTFNPFEPGSPVCPGDCEAFGSTGPLGITLPIVRDINSLTPGGNPIINEWLAAVAGGYANIPTQTDIDYTVALLDTGLFTFSSESEDSIVTSLAEINPALPNLVINAGLLTDPGYLAVSPGVVADPPLAEYGGLDPNLVLPDLLQILGVSSATTDFSQVVDPGSAAAALDTTALSADLSALLGNFGVNLAPDLSSVLTSLF
jgi:hypothetical protein